MKTTIPLLQGAGAEVNSIQDILQMGIYITNAVKTPKTEYTIDKSSIENSLPYLEAVWLLFGKAGGPKTIKAGEALEEALCFGWIDGQTQ